MKHLKLKQNRKLIVQFTVLLLVLVLFTACSNKENIDACLDGQTYRLLNGLWHGIIAPINLIGMLYKDDVTLYAPNNNGVWYALGFLIGSGGWGFLGGRGLGRRR